MLDWLHQLYDPDGLKQLIAGGSLLLLVAIVFAETGLLVGFFLPGDSLLVTAGVLTALDPADLSRPALFAFWPTAGALAVAAIAGDWLNFHIGAFTGSRIWQRPDGRFFKRRHLEEAQEFYRRHGGLALAAARFIPIARTFVPFAAGMSRMPFRSFMGWNVGGAVAWVLSMLALGHWFGGLPAMRDNLHLLVLCVVAVSFIPVAIGVIKRWRAGRSTSAPPGN
jgi:membrane-associated protein